MKTNNFNKKLSLNKSTIVNLNDREMSNVKGGWDTVIVCESYFVCSQPEQSCIPPKPK